MACSSRSRSPARSRSGSGREPVSAYASLRIVFSRALLTALAGALLPALACAPAPPSETVRAYVRALGRDPGRTLTLVSPQFQVHHEIPLPVPGGDVESAIDPLGLEAVARAELAWLGAIRPAWYAQAASALDVTIVSEEAQDAQANVVARLGAPGTPPFELRFLLSRERSGSRWRIDAIEASNIPPASQKAACIVAPSRQLGCFP